MLFNGYEFDTVNVLVTPYRESDALDDMGEKIQAPDTRARLVSGVLFDPGATSNVAQQMNMRGVVIDAEFHFPKRFIGSLRDCLIEYDGHTYRVIGDPQPYMDKNTPGSWNRPVQCKEVS